jgi:uncharacterized protein (DUF1697 family)
MRRGPYRYAVATGETKSVALLRGINVGRNKRIAMSDLRELVQGLGYHDAITHLQSGNIVFTGTRKPSERVAADLSGAIRAELGLDVTVVVRSRDELAAVVAGNPMPEHTGDPKKFHVTFLAAEPERGRLDGIDPATYLPDEFRVVGREVYLWFPEGVLASRLGNDFWEKRIGLAATTRNWRTVTRLLELASA